MREILFKGKSVNTGEWVESMTIANGTIKRKRNDVFMEIDENKWVGIEPKSLSQYTGKTTNNQHPVFYDVQKVFENDIISIGKYSTKYKVVFENYEWVGISNEGDRFGAFKIRFSAIREPITIHGNIFDNPELINS